MGNINFSDDSLFSWYCIMLAVAGLTALVGSFMPRLPVQARVVMTLVGIAGLGYAYYLTYVFDGGTYVVNFYILLFPAFVIIGVLRGLAMRRDAKKAPKRRAVQEDQWKAESDWYAQRKDRVAQTSTAGAAEAAEPQTDPS